MPVTQYPDPQRQSQFYADVPGKRLLAWVIDALIIFLISTLIVVMTAFVGLFFLPLVVFMTSMAYRTITIAGRSATFGMRIAAIELRNSAGLRLSFGEAFLHTLGYLITISTAIAQMISIILMCASEKGQSLSDMVLGTVMLNTRAK